MIICSPELGISPKSVLGGEVYDRELLARFAKGGHQVEVLLPKNKPYDKLSNLHVEYAPIKIIFPAYLYSIIIIPYLFKKYKETKFDILRVHVHFLAFGALFFKLFYKDVPIVAHYHLDENSLIFNLVNNFFLNRCDVVIADSIYLKKQLIKKFKLSPNKVKVIYCGTDLNIKPGPKDGIIERKFNTYKKVVLIYMGRLISRKRPDFLIEVFRDVHKKFPKTTLLIFGEGPLKAKLKAQINQYKLQKSVFLTGFTFGKEKNRFYNTSDIFVFPSINEGFVLVILEALAAGLPIVTSRAVSFEEAILQNQNGYLVPPFNKTKWIEALQKLINNVSLRKRMGEKSRYIAEKRFSWDMTAQNNIEVYESLLYG